MKVGVRILPKAEVLDSQGRAVEQTLEQHGLGGVQCRVGQYVVLDMGDLEPVEAKQKATKIAEFVLHNPLIESFEIEEWSEGK